MKNCPKCNQELADDALFCNNCGAKLDAVEAKEEKKEEKKVEQKEEKKEEVKAEEPKKEEVKEEAKEDAKVETTSNTDSTKATSSNNNAVIAIIAAIAVVIVIIIAIVANASAYKKPINTVVKLLNKQSIDIEAYADCFAPPIVGDSYAMAVGIVKSTSKDAYTDLNDEIKDLADDAFGDLEDEYGDHIKFSYKIKTAKKMKKGDLKDAQKRWEALADLLKTVGVDDDDLYEDLSDNLDDEYDEYISDKNIDKLAAQGEKLVKTLDDVKVTAGYEVKIKAFVKGSDGDDDGTIEFNVIKLNGKWIIDLTSVPGFDSALSSARYMF